MSAHSQVDVSWGTILLINGLGVGAIAYFGGYTFPEHLMLGIFAAGLAVYGVVQLIRGIVAGRNSAAGTVADGPPPGPDRPENTQ